MDHPVKMSDKTLKVIIRVEDGEGNVVDECLYTMGDDFQIRQAADLWTDADGKLVRGESHLTLSGTVIDTETLTSSWSQDLVLVEGGR